MKKPIVYIDTNNKLRLLPEAGTDNGYWVKEGFDDIKVFDISTSNHVRFIIENPEKFLVTRKEIDSLYAQYNEPLGLEGKAREALIKKVASQGWVRVRHYQGRQDYWSIQVDSIHKKARWNTIKRFVKWAIEHKVMTSHDDAVILGYEDEDKKVYNFQNGGVRKMLVESNLKESGLNRLFQYTLKYDCSIISAYRSEYSYEENRKRTKSLMYKLQNLGYDLTEVSGVFIEDYETPEATEVRERSFFVVDSRDSKKLKSNTIALGNQFEQDSVFYIPKATSNESPCIIGTTYKEEAWLGFGQEQSYPRLKLGTESQFMTKVRGRPLYFTEDCKPLSTPEGVAGRMALNTGANLPWFKLD